MDNCEKEYEIMQKLVRLETLGENKANILAKLLTDQALATGAQNTAKGHFERKQKLLELMGVEVQEKTQRGESDEA
ncbi:MAG: hypothetical protein IJX98_07105 [Clostridia bacterium]|nr:hypothetical protein [Clostridia bacterium]